MPNSAEIAYPLVIPDAAQRRAGIFLILAHKSSEIPAFAGMTVEVQAPVRRRSAGIHTGGPIQAFTLAGHEMLDWLKKRYV